MTATSKHDENVCPLCAGSDFKPYKLGLVRCQTCTMVLSPAIWQPQANEMLEEEWFGENYQPVTSFWVRWFEAWNNRSTLSRLNALRLPGKRLLEIGVGSGSFLNAAKDGGYVVMGCDLSEPICRQVENRFDIPMQCGFLESLEGEGRFDVVVMNHVLEHVSNPSSLLQNVQRLLSLGGVVHIAVPNIECWEAMLSGWTSYEPYHLTYFNPALLERVCRAVGFSPLSIKTRESFSGWFLALLRTTLGINRIGGAVRCSKGSLIRHVKQRSGIVEHTYRIGMVLSGGALWPISWLQSKLGYGDEIICIARKQ